MEIFTDIKQAMRFVNNASEELVIRANEIYSSKRNELLAIIKLEQ